MPPLDLPWLDVGSPFPDPALAWGEGSDAPGLLAAGAALDPDTLLQAYSRGIFPWFSTNQPILWWSPDPRMVLRPVEFKLHRSLRQAIRSFQKSNDCELRVDTSFESVIRACADSPRNGQSGTWIVPQMVQAYCQLHRSGYAHSIETWINGELAGGLYCVAVGGAVFGESMFARTNDASKIALAALVALCREHDIEMIDCQQNTRHLASLGAKETPRALFLAHVAKAQVLPGPLWRFSPLYWEHVLSA